MVDIAPFKALRYNPSKVPNLSQAICPPYDVISVPEYLRYLQRSPVNIVRVELPLTQGKEDRYANAAAFWTRWQKQRVLNEDREPGFYGYEQRFAAGSKTYFRRGFFAALRLETPGRGHIRPHERTFPKHKEDRLHLMRATQSNVSPIFGIFSDSKKHLQTQIEKWMREKPLMVARDDKGVTHRVWRWTAKDQIQTLQRALRGEEVFIADGHHRYETAWNYSRERQGGGRTPADYVLTFLCPLEDPGLVIHPTHRAVRWNGSMEGWQERLGKHFTIRPIPRLATLLTKLRARQEGDSIGMVVEGGKFYWLKPKSAGSSPLAVVQLHERILQDIPGENVTYAQDPRQMIEAIQRSEANVAFLLPPPDKEAFARICKAGRLLPQKSTYFYPKLATGLVMRSLKKGSM